MSGPFTTITVDEYYRMQDRIRALELAIGEAEKSLAPEDSVRRILLEALRQP